MFSQTLSPIGCSLVGLSGVPCECITNKIGDPMVDWKKSKNMGSTQLMVVLEQMAPIYKVGPSLVTFFLVGRLLYGTMVEKKWC